MMFPGQIVWDNFNQWSFYNHIIFISLIIVGCTGYKGLNEKFIGGGDSNEHQMPHLEIESKATTFTMANGGLDGDDDAGVVFLSNHGDFN